MNKKSFTLVEILVALIVLAVLASLSITTFQKTIQANEDRLCRQNLKVIQAAIDIYTLENDNLPTTLAELEPRYIYLAYLKVKAKPYRDNSLLSSLKNMLGITPALAQSLPPLGKYYGYDKNVFICPAHTPRPAITTCASSECGSYSFNFSSDTFDNTTKKLKKTSSYAIVFDSANRHRRGGSDVANGITPGKITGKRNSDGTITEDIAGS